MKLTVDNFGPINHNKPIEFKNVTIFIGNNGTGKSYYMKLFSLFSSLEMDFNSGKIKTEDIESLFEFNNRLAYYGISEYLDDLRTFIHYEGNLFNITFESGRLKLDMNGELNRVSVPSKINYVPAERSLIPLISNSEIKNIKDISGYLLEFIDKYNDLNREPYRRHDFSSGQFSLRPLLSTTKCLDNEVTFNIVEEPEQNLYPKKQKEAILKLVKQKNTNKSNRLVISSHSLFVVSYISQCVNAGIIKSDNINNKEILEKLREIHPIKSTLKSSDVVIYEMKDDSIYELEFKYGLPSSDNILNEHISDINDMCYRFLELEGNIKQQL